jgi:hypothetical protein
MFKLEINRPWGLTAARAWARLLLDRILSSSNWDSTTKRVLEHRHANNSSTTAAMYAPATAMDTAPMAGAQGRGAKGKQGY